MAGEPFESATARTVVIDGRELLHFGGCDYLALARDPAVVASAIDALPSLGISSGASRTTSGNAITHVRLEDSLRGFLDAPSVLLTPDGYSANHVAAQAIDARIALIDEHAHPSLFDAARAGGLEIRTFRHLDPDDARHKASGVSDSPLALMTDGVFPSEGRVAPLERYLDALPHDASLVVDDCHAFGTLGRTGRGSPQHAGVENDPRVVLTATLTKALGTSGGFIAATDATIARARTTPPYVCASPPPPACAAAAVTAISLIRDDTSRLQRLRHNGAELRRVLLSHDLPATERALPVFAFTLGSDKHMRSVSDRLIESGVLVPLIAYPSESDGLHFRATVSCAHTPEDLNTLEKSLGAALKE